MKKKLIGFFSVFTLLAFSFMTAFEAPAPISKEETHQGISEYVESTYINLSKSDKDQLIDELYAEKTDPSNQISVPKTSNEQANSHSEAYNRMMEEENYIVDLINEQGESTTLDNWEFNFNYLKEHYNELAGKAGVKMYFVDSYIQAYTTVEMDKDMPKSKVNEAASLS